MRWLRQPSLPVAFVAMTVGWAALAWAFGRLPGFDRTKDPLPFAAPFFAAGMTVVFARFRRQELADSGLDGRQFDDVTWAVRHGELPPDPWTWRAALGWIVRRRAALQRQRYAPLVLAGLAVLMVVAAVRGSERSWTFAAVFAALAVVAQVSADRLRHNLERAGVAIEEAFRTGAGDWSR